MMRMLLFIILLFFSGTVAAQINQLGGDCTAGTGTPTTPITCLQTNGRSFTSAATTGIGTSGATIPLLSTANTWSQVQNLPGITESTNITKSGSSGAGCFICGGTGSIGWTTLNGDGINLLQQSDSVNASGVFQTVGLTDALQSGWAGNRTVLPANIYVYTQPSPGDTSARALVAVLGNVQTSYSLGGTNYTNLPGALWGFVATPSAYSGAGWLGGITGVESGPYVGSNVGIGRRLGMYIDGADSRSRGQFADAGLMFGDGDTLGIGYKDIISFGSPASDNPGNSDSTLIKIHRRAYSGFPAFTVTSGVDFREGTFSGMAFESPNAGIDGSGNAYHTSVTTTGTIQAQTATLSSVMVASAGIYGGPTFPTYSVSAPPSGTTATVTVATMVGITPSPAPSTGAALGFGATGGSYMSGDSLTCGSVGTLAVTAVNSSGGITGYNLTPIAVSTAPSNPVACSGGSGSGASMNFAYTQSGGQYSITATGTQYGSTGKGYAVSDTWTPTGDTGTEPTYTVGSVNSAGGITSLTLSTAGSVTVISGTNHTGSTSGHGIGASINPTWGVGSVTVSNSGSGYLPQPLPVVFPSNGSAIINAALTAVMTPLAATLKLNPNGGAVTTQHYGGTGTAPTITAGTGAGTSPTISLDANAHDSSFDIILTTGASPAASATIATVTFATTYSNAPHCPKPGEETQMTAALSGVSAVYQTVTTTTYQLLAGTAPLAASTAYRWSVICEQ